MFTRTDTWLFGNKCFVYCPVSHTTELFSEDTFHVSTYTVSARPTPSWCGSCDAGGRVSLCPQDPHRDHPDDPTSTYLWSCINTVFSRLVSFLFPSYCLGRLRDRTPSVDRVLGTLGTTTNHETIPPLEVTKCQKRPTDTSELEILLVGERTVYPGQ